MNELVEELVLLLTKENLEKARSPKDFCEYADRVRYLLQETFYYPDKKLLDDCSAKFKKEVFPFSLVIKKYFYEMDDLICQWIDGNQKYDAVIKNSDQNILFEITLAGEDPKIFNLRNKEIEIRGHTIINMPPAIKKIGYKMYKLLPHVFTGQSDYKQQRQQLIENLITAVKRKLNKRYSQDTNFIIHFSDLDYWDHFNNSENLKEEIVKELKEMDFGFDRNIYFIGHNQLIDFLVGKQ